jgi:hypothetical protein
VGDVYIPTGGVSKQVGGSDLAIQTHSLQAPSSSYSSPGAGSLFLVFLLKEGRKCFSKENKR